MAQNDYIKDGIVYQYKDGGIEIPEKITTINNSNYHLVDTRHIDWNNSKLSYIPKIQKDIFDEYKYLYLDETGNPIENAEGIVETRYHKDTNINPKDTDFTYLPIWKNEGSLQNSTELLDLVNYILSRIIYADDKLIELDSLLNRGRITVDFIQSEMPEWLRVDPDNDDRLLNSEVTIKPQFSTEAPTLRSFNIVLHLNPKNKINADIKLQVDIYKDDPITLDDNVILAKPTATTSASADTTMYTGYKITCQIYGFDKNYDYADLKFTLTSANDLKNWNAIDPISFNIKVKKDVNTINKIIINNIEYVYVSINKYEEDFENVLRKNSNFPSEYVLIQRLNLLESQLKLNDKNEIEEIIWNKPGNNTDDPVNGSVEYYVNEGLFYGLCKDGTALNENFIPLKNTKSEYNKIKIYTKYPKLINNEFTAADYYDEDDAKNTISSSLSLIGNGIKCGNDVLTDEKIFNGTWDDVEQCFIFSFKTEAITGVESDVKMSITTTGTRYISSNKTLFSLPVKPTSETTILWKFNETVWNTIIDNTDKDTKDGFKYKLTNKEDNTHLKSLDLVFPIFYTDSFTESGSYSKKEVIEKHPELQSGSGTLNESKFVLFKNNRIDYETNLIDGFLDVYPENIEEAINIIQELIEIDYSPIITKLNNDGLQSTFAKKLEKIIGSTDKLREYLTEEDAKSIGETFIKLEQNYSGTAKKINSRLCVKRITAFSENTHEPIFNNNSESADYFDLPINFKVKGQTIKLNNKNIRISESLLPANIRIIRGSNKLTGIVPKINDSGNTDSVSVKLLEELKFINLYGERQSFNSDKNGTWKFIGRNKRINKADAKDSEKLPTLTIDYSSDELELTTTDTYLRFDSFTQTNFDENDFYLYDSPKNIRVYPTVYHDNDWHAVDNTINSNLVLYVSVKRLNRTNDGLDRTESPNKIIQGVFSKFEKINPNLHQMLNEHDIHFIQSTDLDNTPTRDNGDWIKNIVAFIHPNKNDVFTLNLSDILTNVPQNDAQNKKIKIIAKIIDNVNETDWNMSSTINTTVVNEFESDPNKDYLQITSDNKIKLINIKELLNNQQNGGNNKIVKQEPISSTNISYNCIRVKIYVWVPMNNIFQATQYIINLKLILDTTIGENSNEYGELMLKYFNKEQNDLFNLVQGLFTDLKPDENYSDLHIPPYFYHIFDKDFNGEITLEEIQELDLNN